MKQKDIIAIIAVAVVLGGLYLFSGEPTLGTDAPQNTQESQVPPVSTDISVGAYKLSLYGSPEATSPQNVADRGYTLVYAAGEIKGKICNTFSGPVSIADGHIKADGLVSTKMACDPKIMKIETDLFAALAANAEFRSSPEGLVVLGSNSTLFVFEKVQ